MQIYPGIYRTRNGKKVTVTNVLPTRNGNGTLVSFPVIGFRWKHEDSIGHNPKYELWMIDGHFSQIYDTNVDLIERIGD